MIPPTAELNGWTMKQWALAFAFYGEHFHGLDEALQLQRRYRADFNKDPDIDPPLQTLHGHEYRAQNYRAAAKLYEAYSLKRAGRSRALH